MICPTGRTPQNRLAFMKEIDLNIKIAELSVDELSPEYRTLVEAARKATYRSYSPYSNFRVGAAILLDNGEVVTGSNQENAAYPSSLCAERTACYYAHSAYPDSTMEAIAIAARGTDGSYLQDPISPCGGCRQALIEYENLAGKAMKVILVGADKVYVVPSVTALLPLAFTRIE